MMDYVFLLHTLIVVLMGISLIQSWRIYAYIRNTARSEYIGKYYELSKTHITLLVIVLFLFSVKDLIS